MTDSRLLELRRAWETSGDPQDEAALCRERLRTGELSEAQVELAAFCGRKGAQLIASGGTEQWEAVIWLHSLAERWGAQVLLRAVLLGHAWTSEQCAVELPETHRELLAAAETWITSQDRDPLEELREEEPPTPPDKDSSPRACLEGAALSVVQALRRDDPRERLEDLASYVPWQLATAIEMQVYAQAIEDGDYVVEPGGQIRFQVAAIPAEDAQEQVLAAIQERLGHWALTPPARSVVGGASTG